MDRAFLYTKIAYLRNKFHDDTQLVKPTPKQLTALCLLMESGLKDKDNRTLILRTITGIMPLMSSKQLMMHTVSVLIDELKVEAKDDWSLSDNGQRILEDSEKFIEDQADDGRREEMYQMWVKQYTGVGYG